MGRAGYRGACRQGGAIGVLGAVVMLLVVLCIALALDTGRLYMEQRHLQRVADLAALEAANRTEEGVEAATDAELGALAEVAARRNGHDADEAGRGILATGGGLCRSAGIRTFTPLASGASATCSGGGRVLRNVVQARARHTTPASLAERVLGEGEVTLEAQAAARRRPRQELVTFSLGSRLLKVENATLSSALLGAPLAASLAGYDGVLNARVTLADLLALEAVAGTAGGGLVENATLDLRDLLAADLAAIAQGEDLAAELTFLDEALDLMIRAGLTSVELSELLQLSSQAPEDALNASVRLADLLVGVIFLGQEDRAVSLDELGLTLPAGLGALTMTLEVVEPPQIAVGPAGCRDGGAAPCPQGDWATEARTAQLNLAVEGVIEVPLIAEIDLRLEVLGAGARGGIEELEALDESGGYRLFPAAYGNPLAASLALGVDAFATDIDDIDEDGVSSGIVAGLGIDPGGALIGDLLGVVDEVLTGLLGGLFPDDSLDEAVQPAGGPQEESLEGSWVGAELAGEDGDFVEWPDETRASFSAGTSTLAAGLTESLHDLDVEAGLLGGSGALVAPVAALLEDVIVGVVVDALAAQVIDPVLEELGVSLDEAEMVILEVTPSAGGAELVL
ncbi:pilus assembly protein TadG-related protein [Halomonas organivorans]